MHIEKMKHVINYINKFVTVTKLLYNSSVIDISMEKYFSDYKMVKQVKWSFKVEFDVPLGKEKVNPGHSMNSCPSKKNGKNGGKKAISNGVRMQNRKIDLSSVIKQLKCINSKNQN